MCDREKLQKLSVKQLRELCATKNVSVSGKKAALINRLLAAKSESDSDDDSLHSALGVMSSTRKDAAKKEEPRATQFTFNDIGDSLEKFSGESADSDVCEWLEEFEKACETFGWNDVQKFVYGRRLLKGTAKLFVQSSTGLNDWGKLKKALEEEFEVKVSSAEIHELLRSRKKKSDESFLQYIYHMQSIAKRGHIDEETVCEYVVRGIVDDPVNKVGLYSARTLAELKESVKHYEKMKCQMRDVSRSAKVFVKSERAKKSETPRTAKSESTNTASGDVRCYNCGSRGHYANDCEAKSRGPKCFVCSEFGHRARDCPKKEVRERKEDYELHTVAETKMPVVEIKVGNSLL